MITIIVKVEDGMVTGVYSNQKKQKFSVEILDLDTQDLEDEVTVREREKEIELAEAKQELFQID